MDLLPMKITFGVYLAFVLLLGVIAYFGTKNFGDYILGGRSLGSFVTALSAGASDMSGWLLMGLPGAVMASGFSSAWIGVGLLLGAYLNWIFVSGRLRIQTEYCNDALTIPEFFHYRFGAKNALLRCVTAIIILFFFTIYCASGIVAGAQLFQSLFEVDYSTALWLGAGATIFYTFLGGFLAVSWTDTLQASLMFFALIATPIMAYLALGGADEVSTAVHDFASANPQFELSIMSTSAISIISALAWGFGYFGQPHILCRFMAIHSVKQLPRARAIGMTWMLICLLGATAVGYLGIAYFNIHPGQAELLDDNTERVFLVFAQVLFNPWIAGIILSAILAAIMSTLSCQLLVSSSAITEDIYKGLIRPHASEKEMVWLGRLMVLIVAAIAIYIARDPESRVLGLVSYAWAGFGAAFGPIVILSVFWRGISNAGAFCGMIAGAVVVVYWKEVLQGDLYEIVPGFFACLIVTIIVSKIKKPDPEVTKKFDLANQALIEAKKS
ncbi:sodium/proline symporter PutP [Brackiella oedipodis]|uniref:sodium/proline symporter PutP n=1 Tax=Brackiella oedipodis TaxID=124225 RepID=UPI00056DC88F|nr:sodium/proline symporter PutP [Brackiella oedipodis]